MNPDAANTSSVTNTSVCCLLLLLLFTHKSWKGARDPWTEQVQVQITWKKELRLAGLSSTCEKGTPIFKAWVFCFGCPGASQKAL